MPGARIRERYHLDPGSGGASVEGQEDDASPCQQWPRVEVGLTPASPEVQTARRAAVGSAAAGRDGAELLARGHDLTDDARMP